MSDDERQPSPAYEPAILGGTKIWTEEEHQILKKYLPEFNETPGTERATWILKYPAQEIRKLTKQFSKKKMTEENKILWDKKCEQIKYWFYNQNKADRPVKIPGIETQVTFLQVFRHHHKQRILDEAKRLAEADGYSKKSNGKEATFPYYAEASKNIRDELTDTEKEEIEKKVEEWEDTAPPREVQIETMKKKGHRILVAMDRIKFRSMGMRTFSLECHAGPDDDMRYSKSETKHLGNDPTAMPSFSQFDPDAVTAVMGAFKRYSQHLQQLESNPGSEIQEYLPPKFETAHLKFNTHGLPEIPAPIKNAANHETAETRQSILRTIFNKHSELAGGPKKAPYSKMVATPWDFTSPEYFPKKLTLKDPSDYKAQETKDILTLWRKRQADRKIPFRWTHIALRDETVIAKYPKKLFDGLQTNTSQESESEEDADAEVDFRRKPKNINMDLFDTDDSDDSDSNAMDVSDEEEGVIPKGKAKAITKQSASPPPKKEESSPKIKEVSWDGNPDDADEDSEELGAEVMADPPVKESHVQSKIVQKGGPGKVKGSIKQELVEADVPVTQKKKETAIRQAKPKAKKLQPEIEQGAVATSSKIELTSSGKKGTKRKAEDAIEVPSSKKSRNKVGTATEAPEAKTERRRSTRVPGKKSRND